MLEEVVFALLDIFFVLTERVFIFLCCVFYFVQQAECESGCAVAAKTGNVLGCLSISIAGRLKKNDHPTLPNGCETISTICEQVLSP